MKVLNYTLATALVLIFIACNGPLSSADSPTAEIEQLNKEFKTAPDSINHIGGNYDNNDQRQDQQQPQPKIDWDKKIVKNGTLQIEVKKMDEFGNTVRDAVRRAGGYIAQEQQNSSDYRLENTITLKVPVDQFETVIATVSSNQEKVIERKISSEDVTGEVVDTRARIEAKKRVRDKYLDLLKQARNMEEILHVQNEVNDVQEQIEAASGRVNYLNHAAAMSTIRITYFQVIGQPIQDDKTPGFGERTLTAFKNGASWVLEFFIFLVNIWPFLLFVLMVFLLIRRLKPKARPVG